MQSEAINFSCPGRDVPERHVSACTPVPSLDPFSIWSSSARETASTELNAAATSRTTSAGRLEKFGWPARVKPSLGMGSSWRLLGCCKIQSDVLGWYAAGMLPTCTTELYRQLYLLPCRCCATNREEHHLSLSAHPTRQNRGTAVPQPRYIRPCVLVTSAVQCRSSDGAPKLLRLLNQAALFDCEITVQLPFNLT